jgi:hypothetical protein
VLTGQQAGGDGALMVGGSGTGAQGHGGEQAGLRLNSQVGLIAVVTLLPALVDVAGLGIDGGDDAIRCGAAGDPPPSVGAIRAVGGLSVLAGDQGQQPDRLLGRLVQMPATQLIEQSERVGDQPADQAFLASSSSQAIFGLPGSV